MKHTIKRTLFFLFSLLFINQILISQNKGKIVDEVIWMIGDEPILLSDVEYQKLRILSEGKSLPENADCLFSEQLAIQMLFLNKAKSDSITIDESMIRRYIESDVQNMISQVGSKEKLEEYFGKNIAQIKEDRLRMARNNEIVRTMQQKIVSNISVTPTEIRSFYNSTPIDSIPFIPNQIEIQILIRKPEINLEEIDRVKRKLRGFKEKILKKEASFSMLARLYSEDQRTASLGGEYGFVAKTSLEKEFSNVVFNLNNNNKISPIIETEEGFHLVQLIEKKGNLINFRHILLRPNIENGKLEKEITLLDSISNKIKSKDLNFDQAVFDYSQDENTINNAGLLINNNYQSNTGGSSFFTLEELPQEISREANLLKKGEISSPFILKNKKGNKEVAIIKIKNKKEGHRATISSDFQIIKNLALIVKREKVIKNWIKEQQKKTFIEINSRFSSCKFEYPNWIHENH